MNESRLLEGRAAVVSGAGQGLGEAFARALSGAGARVAILDLDAAHADQVARSIREQGGEAIALACDVRDVESCGAAARQVKAALGDVSVLVNNAGVSTRAQLADPNFNDEIDRVMAVNLKGVLNLTRAFVPQLEASRGSVVNIASIASLLASFASIPYAASKGAVAQATKFLARDLAAAGVRVNALAPGFVVTPLTADLQGPGSRAEKVTQRTLLKRVAHPDDLTGPLLFLASDLSKYITGLVLPVDGGYSAN
ncbi:glucose 1-dehydrogenase [Ramlibacter sp. G-1-2-2]|uniref:Glucose 1-dehydrogenase n=1 Tax=Ramlibacter agri TaxID=2728837 RepID=A0A848HBN6_9BURK|nr:glucose 1-dehydrogenase [Ramlibacter agri]NML47472.1 glucose 1-dehydrogenase [Ramlibacter agri]